MPAPDDPLAGDTLLAAVTETMVALHQRYHHRKPVTAKTLLLDGELLVCVLGGVYTDVEKTMIELQRIPIVHETRSAFQNAMQHRFISAVERLTGLRPNPTRCSGSGRRLAGRRVALVPSGGF